MKQDINKGTIEFGEMIEESRKIVSINELCFNLLFEESILENLVEIFSLYYHFVYTKLNREIPYDDFVVLMKKELLELKSLEDSWKVFNDSDEYKYFSRWVMWKINNVYIKWALKLDRIDEIKSKYNELIFFGRVNPFYNWEFYWYKNWVVVKPAFLMRFLNIPFPDWFVENVRKFEYILVSLMRNIKAHILKWVKLDNISEKIKKQLILNFDKIDLDYERFAEFISSSTDYDRPDRLNRLLKKLVI